MRILYVAMEHDYGDPSAGRLRGHKLPAARSREWATNCSLRLLPARPSATGTRMRQELIAIAAGRRRQSGRHLLHLYDDEIACRPSRPSAGVMPHVNWFADDHWRFDSFSKRMARTVLARGHDRPEVFRVRAEGSTGCTCRSGRATGTPTAGHVGPRAGVTFVGQPHGDRREIVGAHQGGPGHRGRVLGARLAGRQARTGRDGARVHTSRRSTSTCRTHGNRNTARLSASADRQTSLNRATGPAPPRSKAATSRSRDAEGSSSPAGPTPGGVLRIEGEEVGAFDDNATTDPPERLLASPPGRARHGWPRPVTWRSRGAQYNHRFEEIFRAAGVAQRVGMSTGEARLRVMVPVRRRVRLSELWTSLPVTRMVASRDIKIKYKQAALGPLWLLIAPLGLLAAVTIAFYGVTKVDIRSAVCSFCPRPGLCVWIYIQMTLMTAPQALVMNAVLVRRSSCPRIALVNATLISNTPPLGVTLAVTLLGIAIDGRLPVQALLAAAPRRRLVTLPGAQWLSSPPSPRASATSSPSCR